MGTGSALAGAGDFRDRPGDGTGCGSGTDDQEFAKRLLSVDPVFNRKTCDRAVNPATSKLATQQLMPSTSN